MRKFLMAALLLIFFIPQIASAEKIIIMHTNDMHAKILNSDDGGKSIGLAEIAAAVKTVKKQNKITLFLDAGDTFHGMPLINISKGENMIPLLNAAGYDAMAPGNQDFNYGTDQLENIAKKLKFPILAANVIRKSDGTSLLSAYKIFKYGKIKIGVFGLATPETAYKNVPEKVKKVDFFNPIETAREMVKILRPQCDIIIAVMHMGLDKSSEFTGERIARETSGIDVIIDGHSHTKLPEGMTVNGTLIAQTECFEHFLGQVTIDFEDGKIISKSAKLLSAEDVKKINPVPNKKIVDQISKIDKKNKKIFEVVVAHSDKFLTGERELVRRQETELGNLCADAFRWKTGADIAFMNGAGIRADLPEGNITRGKVSEIIPFGNSLQKAEISGKAVRQMLEHSVFGYPETFGGFLAVSGMSFSFDPSQPVGQRVQDIFIGGEILDENKIYTIGGVDFIFMGGNDFTMLKGLKMLGNYGTLDDALAEYLKEHGAAVTDFGRIKNLKDVEEKRAA